MATVGARRMPRARCEPRLHRRLRPRGLIDRRSRGGAAPLAARRAPTGSAWRATSLCARDCRGSGRGGAGGGDRRRDRARPAGARGGSSRSAAPRSLLVVRRAGWGDARDEADALAPTLVVLAALLVLGDGCERAGLFDALAARLAHGARGLGLAAAGARGRRGRGRDRGARARRDRRAAHAGGVRGGGEGAAGRAPGTSTRARTWRTRRRCCCRSRTSRTCWRSGRASCRSRASRR